MGERARARARHAMRQTCVVCAKSQPPQAQRAGILYHSQPCFVLAIHLQPAGARSSFEAAGWQQSSRDSSENLG